VPLVNAFLLSNLFKYYYKSYIAKNYILWATFLIFGLHYGSVFNQLDILANTFSVITQSNGNYAIQGQSRSPILVPINIASTNFLLDNNTNLHPIYIAMFPEYCSLLVKLLLQMIGQIGQIITVDRGYLSLTHLFGVNP